MRAVLALLTLSFAPFPLLARDVHLDSRDHDVTCEVGDRLCLHFFDKADVKENDNETLRPGSPWSQSWQDETVYFFVARRPAESLRLRLCSPRGCLRLRVRIR
jgi:hypothetical protein